MHARSQPGDRVLVDGGAGGVGSFAVQIAVALGAEVTTTERERHLGLVGELGAHRAVGVDRPGSDLGEERFDVVIDTVGGDTLRRSFAQLGRAGRLATLQGPPDPDLAAAHGVEATFFVVEADGKTLAAVSGMVDSGQLHMEIATTFPLRDGAAAYRSGAASPSARQDGAGGHPVVR